MIAFFSVIKTCPLFLVLLPQVQHLTLMGMELHARTRRDLEPDPEFDPICALFYCLSSDAPLPNVDSSQLTGAIVVDRDHESCDPGSAHCHSSTLDEDICTRCSNVKQADGVFKCFRRSQSDGAPAGQVGRLWAAGEIRHRREGAVSGAHHRLQEVCVCGC